VTGHAPGADTSASGVFSSLRIDVGGKHPRSRGPAAIFTVLCLIGPVTSAATALSSAQTASRPDKTLTETLQVLDNAIRLLGAPSSDYGRILRDAVAALPTNAEGRVSEDIRTFLTRAPQPGADFRCSPEFVRSRARGTLWRLRDTLLGASPAPVEPAVCYAVPFAVDVTHMRPPGGLVDIYGYDFDVVTPQLVLVNSDGYEDVTPALVARSHYHLALDVGNGAVPFSSKSLSLGLAWGHLIRHSIALMQPTTPLCLSRVETVPAGRTISYAPPVSGKRLFRRPGTKVWADAILDYEDNALQATICVTATEQVGDDRPFGGCTIHFLYTTDPDRVIEGVVGQSSSRVFYVEGNRPGDLKSARRGGPVAQWTFAGFQPSGVENDETSVTARLNQVRVVSSERDGCISPMAYLEAKRTRVPDPATRRSLDPQLKKIDPAILKVRPRFAPSTF
jgi:hypothetical protein